MNLNERRSTAGPDSLKTLGKAGIHVDRSNAVRQRSLGPVKLRAEASGSGSSGHFTKKGDDFRRKTTDETVKSGNKVPARKNSHVVSDAVNHDFAKMQGEIDALTEQLRDINSEESRLKLQTQRINADLVHKKAIMDWHVSEAQTRASKSLKEGTTVLKPVPRKVIKICDLQDCLTDDSFTVLLWRMLPLLVVFLVFLGVTYSTPSYVETIKIRHYVHTWCTGQGAQATDWTMLVYLMIMPCSPNGPIFIPGYALLPVLVIYLLTIIMNWLRTPCFLKTELVLLCESAHCSGEDNRPEFDKDVLPLDNLYIDCRVSIRRDGLVMTSCSQGYLNLLKGCLDARWFDQTNDVAAFRTLRLHEGLLSIALNRRTLKQSKAAQKVSFERAVRLMEAESRFCEDYDRLFETGESIYRHMEQVVASIISNDQATDLLDF